MTMSTYKSLGGPPGGLVVTNDADLAERLDAIAYPGLTANFDAGKTAALAIDAARLEGRRQRLRPGDGRHGARAGRRPRCPGRPGLRRRPRRDDVAPVRGPGRTSTAAASAPPRACAWPTCWPAASGCRRPRSTATSTGCASAPPRSSASGMTAADMPTLASFIARGLAGDESAASAGPEVTEWRSGFTGTHFTVDLPH